jgi:stage II sporulation protein D
LLLLIFAFITIGCPIPARRPEIRQEPTISLFLHETGKIKNIEMEEYIQGVVAAEMDPNWHPNALAAQAILARTFTLEKMEEGGVRERGTDASTDVEEFQAYDRARINDQVREAVNRTRGMVALYRNKYINAWFFADGGGRTAASAVEGLAYKEEPAPYIRSVKDPGYAITLPENRDWTARFPKGEVRRAVKEVTGQDPGADFSARIVSRGPSGRATSIRIGDVTVSAPALRLALGSMEMRSTLVDEFAVQGDALVVSGKGFGHGVGMSQWGARALAEQGKSPEEILQYFFRGIRIERRWN